MYKSVRQSMAWLHSWLGLTFGWLLFTIFLTGAVTYYRYEISLWMQPQFATMQVNQNTAIISAYHYLQRNAPQAKSWNIEVANSTLPVNKIYWQKADGSYESKILDASTGKEFHLTPTQGGDFFYNFHYQLYGVPYIIGRTIVTLAAFIMLITLISGIITHKKILTDFFTLRAFKGQRSYLDFHNVTSVIALPFFLTITFTGLSIYFDYLVPSGIKKLYPDNTYQYFEEIRNASELNSTITIHPTNMLPIQYFIRTTQKEWGTLILDNISVKQPNTQLAQITLTELKDQSITRNQAQITLNAVTGELQDSIRNNSAIATLNAGIYGLHMARFAEPMLRLALFFSGILGCIMIASGLLLWSLKRQMQNKSQKFHFGYYLVNRLNIAVIVGLPLAILGYFYANRLLMLSITTSNYEVYTFFSIWLGSLILACITPQCSLWKTQLKIFCVSALILPFLNLYYLITQLSINSFTLYWPFLRLDFIVLLWAILAWFLHQKINPIQQKAVRKIQAKIKTDNKESSS